MKRFFIVNVKIEIQYVGTKFYGFQRQKKERTIQKEIELSLSRLIPDEKITLTSCGRTDAGVHALMHVSNFRLKGELKIPIENFCEALNSQLPGDILCVNAEIVPYEFHSRFDAKKREYMYVIYNKEIMPPFYRRRAWNVKQKLSIGKLKKILNYLKGEHDFTSFCANIKENKNRVRTITNFKIKKKKDRIYIFIEGYAFLHKMIRMIVGTAVDIITKGESPKTMDKVLKLKSRKKNKYRTAPPGGLYLYKITY